MPIFLKCPSQRLSAIMAGAVVSFLAAPGCKAPADDNGHHWRVRSLSTGVTISAAVLPPGAVTAVTTLHGREPVFASTAPQGGLLRWRDDLELRARRLTVEGSLVDGSDLQLPPNLVSLASDGSGYAGVVISPPSGSDAVPPIVGLSAGALQLVRLSALGALLPDAPLLLDMARSGGIGPQINDFPEVYSRDGAVLVLWSMYDPSAFLAAGSSMFGGTFMYLARISQNVDTRFTFGGAGEQRGSGTLGPDGLAFFWTSKEWEHCFPSDACPRGIDAWRPTETHMAALSAATPSVIPAAPLPPPTPPSGSRLASDGRSYLITWSESEPYPSQIRAVMGQIRNRDFTVGGPSFLIAKSMGFYPHDQITTVFVGTEYFVTWTDGRGLVETGWDVYGARVTPAGVVRDAGGIPLVAGVDDEVLTSVAVLSAERLVVAYGSTSKSTSEKQGNARIITLTPQTAPTGGLDVDAATLPPETGVQVDAATSPDAGVDVAVPAPDANVAAPPPQFDAAVGGDGAAPPDGNRDDAHGTLEPDGGVSLPPQADAGAASPAADAGATLRDAGGADADRPKVGGGCTVAGSSAGMPPAALLLGFAAALRRRRRRP